MAMDDAILTQCEAVIGYAFRQRSLMVRALTHPSYNHEDPRAEHNQRLEFLGDAVLSLVLAESLYTGFPSEREGQLTRYRAMLANGGQLSELAREIRLGEFLRMGEAEASQGGRERASSLEDAMEALIGAVYLDGGLESARALIERLYGDLQQRLERLLAAHNPKGQLQEWVQAHLGNGAIEYRLCGESGPDHRKSFSVEVWIAGIHMGTGKGHSKRLAEEKAAHEALNRYSASTIRDGSIKHLA